MATTCSLFLPNSDATTRFGQALADVLAPGDTILLKGEIGSGKTHLVRAAIQAIGRARGFEVIEVPSPTYTLVQTYNFGDLEIWHADLYRLGDPGEVAELGLDAAFATAVVFVEWPDKLDRLPGEALHVSLRIESEGRCAVLTSNSARWTALCSQIEALDA